MTWTDVEFPAFDVLLARHHADAAAGNESVTREAVAAMRTALASAMADPEHTARLLLRAAAGAGKSFALTRMVVDAAGVPGTRRVGVIAFTNNQIRPLALRLAELLGPHRVCLHLSKDAFAKLPPGVTSDVTTATQASAIPPGVDVVVATASKLKAPGEVDRLFDQLGGTETGELFDVLFVDEAWQLPHHLFDPIERVSRVVVGVGDVGQLPPLDMANNPWRGDRTHNPYRAWPSDLDDPDSTWSRDLPTVWRPPGEALGLWRAFYPSWTRELVSVAAPEDRRLIVGGEAPSAALWTFVGAGAPLLVELDGLVESDAPDVDLPLLDRIEGWLDDLFEAGFVVESARYADDGSPTGETFVDRPGTSDDGDPLVVLLATRNQLVDDATSVVERLRARHGLRERDLVASTVDSWQGRTNAITVAVHPLTGATELDEFNSAFGRLAVACTRATHGLLLVARTGLDQLLAVAPPRPGTPFGEPGERSLPRQTHQRILDAFVRVTVDVTTLKESDVAAV